jgi:2-polyprenyl-3-methyl-5-hydroxy-6-metoxy-1,4-benzoquinol methylase
MQTTDASFAQQSSGSAYLLDNAGKEAPARFDALSGIYDQHTIRHLVNRGVTEGWHCLEVGGGGGSISLWLADRVGPTGHVIATDIDPRFLEPLIAKNLEVQRHDIATDSLPQSAFDLIHARLVLIHVPEREQVLARLVAALKPGGWLIEEEIDSASLLPDPSINCDEVLLKTQIAAMRLVEDHGVRRRWGRLLFGRLRALGLMNVDAEATLSMWHSGSIGASIVRANFEQLRDRLIEGGYITVQEFADDIARLNEPDFMAPSPIMWTAWGQRPPA